MGQNYKIIVKKEPLWLNIATFILNTTMQQHNVFNMGIMFDIFT